MFREMRRKNQALTEEKCEEILNSCTSGVLSLEGDDGYPYGVPLSYAYMDGKLYFHCAKTGHKVDAVRNNPKASFTVISKDEIHGDEFTTYFTSVIAFGKVRILEKDEEIMPAIFKIGERYAPKGFDEKITEHIKMYKDSLVIIEFEIEKLTGKQAKKLM